MIAVMFVFLTGAAPFAVDGAEADVAAWPNAGVKLVVQSIDDKRFGDTEADPRSATLSGVSAFQTDMECIIDGKQLCPMHCGLTFAVKSLAQRTIAVDSPEVMETVEGTIVEES